MAGHDVPDYDSIPDTRDLVPPTAEQVPIELLALKVSVRAIRRDLRTAKTWFQRMVIAFATGSITLAGAVVGVATERGAEQERARADHVRLERHDERLSRLETKQAEAQR